MNDKGYFFKLLNITLLYCQLKRKSKISFWQHLIHIILEFLNLSCLRFVEMNVELNGVLI